MTIIDSFSPIFRFSLDHEVERTGCRPKATDFYSVSETGERILVPAGAGTYDVYTYCTVPKLTGTETDQQLQRIAELSTTATYVERRAPHLIRNHTYIFHFGIARTKFLRSRSRLLGNMLHDRYWFFSSALSKNQVKARIQHLVGRLYAARAEKIVEATRRRGFEPYKDLKRVVEFFREIGSRLWKIGTAAMVRCTVKTRAQEALPVPAPERPQDLQRKAAAAILNMCRGFLPQAYPLFCADLGMVYPGLVGIPSPAAAGG